ncbi:MAG: DNA-3-methyladenine glycosylase [Carboxydocellales bacterium]
MKLLELLSHSFYARSAVIVAKDLLGCYIVHDCPQGGRTMGRVIETEAYLSQDDPACHAARGMTTRNKVMFGPSGKAYIYFTYGMHYCFNVVTAGEGIPEAVLIRALEPLEGLEQMANHRGKSKPKEFCSGPAKLVQAMGIKLEENASDLVTGPIRFYRKSEAFGEGLEELEELEVVTTSRIGISAGENLPLRFYIAGSPWISRK